MNRAIFTAAAATMLTAGLGCGPRPIGVVEIVTMRSALDKAGLDDATVEYKRAANGHEGLEEHYFVLADDGRIGGVILWDSEAARTSWRQNTSPAQLAKRMKLQGPPEMFSIAMIGRLFDAVRPDSTPDAPDVILVVGGLKFGIPLREARDVKAARAEVLRNAPGLRQKYYSWDADKEEAMGVYVWSSRAAADAYLASDVFAKTQEAYELTQAPRTSVFEIADQLR
jgi:heme-degrading monooxygenase HmoA